MSSENKPLDQKAKIKLALLVNSIDGVVKSALDDMDSAEINFICTNYASSLKYDLSRDFMERREKDLKESPFDAIINNNLDI